MIDTTNRKDARLSIELREAYGRRFSRRFRRDVTQIVCRTTALFSCLCLLRAK
jgi:hypothetical protein